MDPSKKSTSANEMTPKVVVSIWDNDALFLAVLVVAY